MCDNWSRWLTADGFNRSIQQFHETPPSKTSKVTNCSIWWYHSCKLHKYRYVLWEHLYETPALREISANLPHGVHVCGGQAGAADWSTVVRPHYPLCQQEITEQAGHQQVLTKQLLEQIWRTKTGAALSILQETREWHSGGGKKKSQQSYISPWISN